MGKYVNLEQNIFSIFGSSEWLAENIKTYPSNFIAVDAPSEFLRISVIPAGEGLNLRSVSGIMLVDIFVPSGGGTRRLGEIADKLDLYLEGQTTDRVQFGSSAMKISGKDKDNPKLFL